MNPYDQVRAVFKPKRIDDLKPRAAEYIGREGVFECLWMIEEGHQYAGQYAMALPADWQIDAAWTPACDLEMLEIVRASPFSADREDT